jgi:hypothetical protein
MTHGGVLGGMLRDIGGTFGIVSFKNCGKGILNEILTEWRVDDEWWIQVTVLVSETPEDGQIKAETCRKMIRSDEQSSCTLDGTI